MQPTLLQTQADVLATQPKLVRLPTVMRMTGLCRSTIYSLIADHQFPGQVQLSKRAVAWRQSEIEAWTQARPCVRQCPETSPDVVARQPRSKRAMAEPRLAGTGLQGKEKCEHIR